MLTKPYDVTFRHLSLRPQEVPDEISGICLSYQSKDAAESFFDFIHRYLSAKGSIPRRLVQVNATRQRNNSYFLTIEVGLGDQLRRIEISGIDRTYVDRIRESLDQFAYYPVAASYELSDGTPVLLSLADNNLFLHRITIDGVEYEGTGRTKIDWARLLQTDYVVLQDND